jgi:hypothetical protein
MSAAALKRKKDYILTNKPYATQEFAIFGHDVWDNVVYKREIKYDIDERRKKNKNVIGS